MSFPQQAALTTQEIVQLQLELRDLLVVGRVANRPTIVERARMLYGYEEAAEVLSVSSKTIERLAAEGEFEIVPLGRRKLIPHESLEAYVTRKRNELRVS